MKKRVCCLIGGMFALVLVSGCINFEQEMTLKSNGSGEVKLHYWMDAGMVNMMKQAPGGGDGDGPKFTEADIRKEYEGKPGLKVKSVKTEEKDGQSHAYVTLAFDNVDALETGGGGEEQYELTKEGGNLKLSITLKGQQGMGGMQPMSGEDTRPGPVLIGTDPAGGDSAAAKQHYDAGMALKKAKKLDEAAAELRKAVEADPGMTDARWALAWTLAATGDKPGARAEFEQVWQADPNSAKGKEAFEAMQRIDQEAVASSAPPQATQPPTPTGPGSGPPPGREDFGKAMEGAGEDMMKGMMGGMGGAMGDDNFKFTVHFPGEVLEVSGPNATKEGNTAKWHFGFGDMMMGSVTMSATAKAGFSLPLIPIAGGLGGLIALLLVASLIKKRKAASAVVAPAATDALEAPPVEGDDGDAAA